MAYLDPSEYVAYGLSADTAEAWVNAASAMIEAHCRRSSLLPTSYTERLRLDRRQGTTQLSYGPVVQVLAARARFLSLPREGAGELLSIACVFGLPGSWVDLDPASVSVDAASGELQLQPHLLGLPYSEVEVTYTAGLAAVPVPVKVACAQIVKNGQATPGLNVKASKLDTLQTQYFSDSLLDSGVRALLRPYMAERLG